MSNLEKPAPFDPAAAVNAIRDKIRLQMLDVIPTEQWDALIKAEMQAFMTDRTEVGQYGHAAREVPAGYKAIVRSVLEERARESVKTLLAAPEWQSQWSSAQQEQVAGKAIAEYLTKHGPEILREAVNQFVSVSMQNVVSAMRSQR